MTPRSSATHAPGSGLISTNALCKAVRMTFVNEIVQEVDNNESSAQSGDFNPLTAIGHHNGHWKFDLFMVLDP